MTNGSSSELLKRSAFQELIRRWEMTHPYNFVCIADMRRNVDAEALRTAALATLEEMRLGIIAFHGRRAYSFAPPTDVEVRLTTDIDRNAEIELNRPFDNADPPVRIAFGNVHSHGTTISITCRHIAFDGHSGSVFARRILLRAIGADIPNLEIGPNQRGRHFLSSGFSWLYPQFYSRAIRDIWRMRYVYSRPADGSAPDVAIRFLRHSNKLLTEIRQAADAPGVTINDVIAARFARGLLAIHASEMTGKQRTICLSLAVSLRQGIAPLARGVGVAAFPVFVSRGEDPIRVVRQQTDIEKRSRSYLRSLIGIGIAAITWPRGGTGDRKGHLRSSYLPTAGFTNVRVPSVPGDEYISNVRGVVSTGPVLPIMLVAVTHADNLQLALVWRAAKFTASEIDFLEHTLTN
jgi:hypothetical protein